MQEKINKIDQLLKQLKTLKSSLKKQEKLRAKSFNANPRDNSQKHIQKIEADLNFHCMDVQKEITGISRTFKDSFLDVSTDKKVYNPSAWNQQID